MTIEYILKRAKELILNGKVKGYPEGVLQQIIEDNPEELELLLDEIAQQANDENSRKAALRLYTPEMVGLAIAYRVSKKEAEERENPKPKSPISEMVHNKLLSMAKK
jgi:acylphosphatase